MSYCDLTAIIPVRIDSDDRLRNLNIVVDEILKLDGIEIIVLEADTNRKIQDREGVKTMFVKDDDLIFHHTKYRNILSKMSSRKFIAVWDSDIIVDSCQIDECLSKLREEEVSMTFPYDGRCYDLDGVRLNRYINDRDLSKLATNIGELRCLYGYCTCGGVFIANREDYINAGGDNEAIKGWGPEDLERYKRWEVRGYKIYKSSGVIYHINHKRGDNSRYFNLQTKIDSFKELFKTCRGE